MQADFRALLVTDAPLAALVSTRVYWNAIPQDAADPAVVMYLIDSAPGYAMGGADGLTSSLVQIDVRAVSAASMWAIRDAIVTALSGYAGTQGDTDFRGVFQRGERQSSEKPGTVLYHRSSLDFEVFSRAAA